MESVERHAEQPQITFDGGDLDCGNGLLLLIRKHMDSLEPGQLLEIRSTEKSVEEELPAWCRLTKNLLISWTRHDNQYSFLIRKKLAQTSYNPNKSIEVIAQPGKSTDDVTSKRASPFGISKSNTATIGAKTIIPPLAVMGIGSWPRSPWLLQVVHNYLEGKMSEEDFQRRADGAVREAVAEQELVGVDVITDGEQRRDNYASFVGKRLENCQLIPLLDLLPMVEHPEEFQLQLEALDVPAALVRHPAVFGKISRRAPLAVHEYQFLKEISSRPAKVSLPGPYLLTRTMFLDCFKERAYQTRDELAIDVIRILREEIQELLEAGVAMVQLDEPILTEVVFGRPDGQRSFMCGALSERGTAEDELKFAVNIINATIAGFQSNNIALHVCRGNWSADENVALRGGYDALLPAFNAIKVGTLFLEFCTPRAGDLDILQELREDLRIGLGVVNPKTSEIETVESIVQRIERAAKFVSIERIMLNPDCGFATFADAPVATRIIAQQKLASIVSAAKRIKS